VSAYDFDDYKKDHLDGQIKDGNGDPRHAGGNNKPDSTLSELDGNGAKVEAASVALENFDSMDYETICAKLRNVSDSIAPGYNDTMHEVSRQIVKGLSDMKDRLESLEGDGGWKGKTHDAAMANLLKSVYVPDELRKAAVSLGVLSEYFAETMVTNRQNVLNQWQTYEDCLRWYWRERDKVKRYFNNFAQDVMKNYYSPEIKDIASHQPAVEATAPSVGDGDGDGKGDHDKDGDGKGDHDKGGDGKGGGNGDHDKGGDGKGGNDSGGDTSGGGGTSGGGNSGGGSGGGGNNHGSPPPFSPPNLSANTPGDGSSGGGSSGGDTGTPKQSFNPPDSSDVKGPGGPSDAGDGSGSDSGGGSIPATMSTLGATSPQLPSLGDSDGPSKTGASGTGAKFDPSKVLTDPKSIDAANKLFNDPKTAAAAKKLFGDPKFADAAKTLFGDGAKGLLGDPKALDAAKTLFGDPEAADAAKTLFGDPETAKAAQKLLNDPHLGDLGKALKDSGALQATGLSGLDSTDGSKDSNRSLLGQSALSNAGGIPGLAAGTAGSPSDGASSLIGGIMDGVNQIVQTAARGQPATPPGFGGGPGFDGAPGGPADHAGGGAGHGGGAGGGAAGPGKLHMAAAGAPVAAANFSTAAHGHALGAAVDSTQAGSGGGGGAPSGGGHGGGGKGGEGKDHKGNRALRGSHNGQDLIGQPDAVVSVIGDDGGTGGPEWSMDTP